MSDDTYACLCCSPLMAELFKSSASIAELEKRWSASEHTTNWFRSGSPLNRRDFVWGGAAFAGAAGLMPVTVQGQETKVRVFAGGTILTVDKSFSEAQATYEAGKVWEKLSSQDYIHWRVSRTLMARYAHQKHEPHYRAELHFLRLGDVAVATNPFELYVDYGLRIKSRSPAAQTMVVQLTTDGAAYLPTTRAVAGGGYSARIVDGVVGPEGGDVLVDRSSKALSELWPGE